METLLHNFNLYSGFSNSFRTCHFLSPNFSSNQVQFFVPANQKPRTTRQLTMALSAGNSSIQQQKVVIPNKYGEKLVGILHETGSPEIVILCHGFQATKEHIIMVNLASSLENAGLASFRFDFPGNGPGKGSPQWTVGGRLDRIQYVELKHRSTIVDMESEGSFQYGNYRREADDIHAVAQHFRGLNRRVNAVVGHSKGGDVVLLYASKYNDISVVVNLSGRYDLSTGIAARLGEDFMDRIKKEGFIDVKKSSGGFESFNFRVTEESLIDRLNTNMHEACLQIDEKCRVLTVHGSADTVIPVEDALEFAKIIPNHKLRIIEGADHRFNNHQSELVSLVVNFIKETTEQDKDATTG